MKKKRLHPGLLLLAGLLLFTPKLGAAENAQATFVVHCYSVGVEALKDRPGVISVAPGWHRANEVDRVVYAPDQVSRQELEAWLQESGTYIRTLDNEMATTKESKQ